MDACPDSSGRENSFQQAELLWPPRSLSMSLLALRVWPGTAPHHLPNPDTIQHHAAIHFVMRGFKRSCLEGGCDHIIFHLIHFFPERFHGFALGDVQWLNIFLLIPRCKCSECRSTSWHVLAGLAVSSDKKKNLKTASLDRWSVDLYVMLRHLYSNLEFMMRNIFKCSLQRTITVWVHWPEWDYVNFDMKTQLCPRCRWISPKKPRNRKQCICNATFSVLPVRRKRS